MLINFDSLGEYCAERDACNGVVVTGMSGVGKTGVMHLLGAYFLAGTPAERVRQRFKGVVLCEGDAFGIKRESDGASVCHLMMLSNTLRQMRSRGLFVIFSFCFADPGEVMAAVRDELGVVPILTVERSQDHLRGVYTARALDDPDSAAFYAETLSSPEVLNRQFISHHEWLTAEAEVHDIFQLHLDDIRFPSCCGGGEICYTCIAPSEAGACRYRLISLGYELDDIRPRIGACMLLCLTGLVSFSDYDGATATAGADLYAHIDLIRLTDGQACEPDNSLVRCRENVDDIIQCFRRRFPRMNSSMLRKVSACNTVNRVHTSEKELIVRLYPVPYFNS